MAWKKTEKKDEWKNKGNDSVIWFTNVPDSNVTYVNYAVFRNNLWNNGFTKRFKTKSQALSFAKSYMKSHKRG